MTAIRRDPTTASSSSATSRPLDVDTPVGVEQGATNFAERLRTALTGALDGGRNEAGDDPRMVRKFARRVILIAANVNRARMDLPPYNKRQIQQAVQAVRHNRLVDAQTLRDAGYRPHG